MQIPSLFVALIAIFLGQSAQAQRVAGVKIDRVLINQDGLNFKIGQIWEAVDQFGGAQGKVRIIQLSEDKAVGLLVDGFVVADGFLRLRAEVIQKEEQFKYRWFLGPTLLKATVKADVVGTSTTSETTMTGSQMGLVLGADRVLSPRQVFRFKLGFDLIDTIGSVDNPPGCGDSDQCRFRIHYLTSSLGFLFQVLQEGSQFNFGPSASFIALLPASQYTNALGDSKINLDGGFEFGAFMHIKTNPITWLELSAQQVLLRKTTLVTQKFERFSLIWMQNF